MLNSIGLPEPGHRRASSRDDLPRLAELGVPLWVSVGGFSARGLRRRAARGSTSDDARGDDRAEPLVPERRGGARDGRRARRGGARGDREAALREALARARGTSPSRARAVAAAGADGLSLVNTIRGLALDPAHAAPAARARRRAATRGRRFGRSRSPACTRAPTRSTLPIVGMGGVSSGRDALELVAAGASAVALGTVLFADPARAGADPGGARGRGDGRDGLGAIRRASRAGDARCPDRQRKKPCKSGENSSA